MATLLLVRHGQSIANLQTIFAGHVDMDLTELGILQAEALAKWIVKHFHVDRIYSSDLARAYHTAIPTATRTGLKIIKSDRLREIDGGKWQGKTYTDILRIFPDEYRIWLNDIGNARCPDGESVGELSIRITDEIRRIGNQHPGETVLITTHATPIRALQTIFEKGNISCAKDVPWVPNASVSVVDYQNGSGTFQLVGFSDYLNELKSSFPNGIV